MFLILPLMLLYNLHPFWRMHSSGNASNYRNHMENRMFQPNHYLFFENYVHGLQENNK